MDPQLEELYEPLHRIKFNDQTGPILSSHDNPIFENLSFANPPLIPPNPDFNLVEPSLGQDLERALQEDYDFNDVVLNYINQVLMEEDEEERVCTYHEPSAVVEAEKSLYEVLGEKYPPPNSRNQYYLPNIINHCTLNESCASNRSDLVEYTWSGYPHEYNSQRVLDFSSCSSKPLLQTSYSSSNNSETRVDLSKFNFESSLLDFSTCSSKPLLQTSYSSSNNSDKRVDLLQFNFESSFSSTSNSSSYNYSGSSSGSGFLEPKWSGYSHEYDPQHVVDFSISCSKPLLQTSYSSTSKPSCLLAPVNGPIVSDVVVGDSQSVLQFQNGLEEASQLLPKSSFYVGLSNTGSLSQQLYDGAQGGVFQLETRRENEILGQGARGKKHRDPEGFPSEEGRGNKQSAISLVCDEAAVRSEMFDKVLLSSGGKNDAALREALQSELNKNVQQNTQGKGSKSNNGKGRGKKQGSKKDVIDLRSLLSLCAQAVASNDQRSANDLLRQIRQHSSPNGDGNQRMAHYFANGLEARLAGVGTPIYSCLVAGPVSALDMLRAYHTFLAICPCKKIGNLFANRTIMAVAEKSTRLHIIDLGIVYGFQWPCLIQRLSSRPGGPPKLRITGLDHPQPGFRPAKRVEETGRRLRDYAESFNVPFEFNAIAKKWETTTIEDLKIDSDEVLVVNCMFRFKHLPEESIDVECPRDTVLNLIKQLKPAVFIQGVVNGAFSSPFFLTRFREALFHFYTLFDMLEATLPRDLHERMLIEREIFGRQAMNVVACEGLERIERPETYKQWQIRNERAGLVQLPLNRRIAEISKKIVKSIYHKDFSIHEDGQWLLQGWKGRIIYALSTWKTAP